MDSGLVWLLPVCFGTWCWVLSSKMDNRLSARALRRAHAGVRATVLMVLRWQLKWFGAWLVVWVLSIAITKDDANNQDAYLFVITMALAHGPIGFWLLMVTPKELVAKGASPDVATGIFRIGWPLGGAVLFLCIAAVAVTFYVP